MRRNEYRESVDIDFLISDINGYRGIRQGLTGPGGINAITTTPLRQLREVRADQYGLRTLLDVDDDEVPLKFDIIHEGRIQLDPPGPSDQICGVATLTDLDAAASKLLANADRWADPGTFSRDLIDLAMLQPDPATLGAAIAKAARAYGTSVERSLHAGIRLLLPEDAGEAAVHWLDKCITNLQIDVDPGHLQTLVRRLSASR